MSHKRVDVGMGVCGAGREGEWVYVGLRGGGWGG